jgi:hypothetical protein
MQTFGYHIFPPFVDAYRSSYEGKLSLKKIKALMRSHAIEWGCHSVGEGVLSGYEAAVYNKQPVVCCAFVGEHPDAFCLVAVVTKDRGKGVTKDRGKGKYWFERIKIIEGVGIIQPEWNVT